MMTNTDRAKQRAYAVREYKRLQRTFAHMQISQYAHKAALAEVWRKMMALKREHNL